LSHNALLSIPITSFMATDWVLSLSLYATYMKLNANWRQTEIEIWKDIFHAMHDFFKHWSNKPVDVLVFTRFFLKNINLEKIDSLGFFKLDLLSYHVVGSYTVIQNLII